jgi:excisionase family DNA binding protein
MSPDLSIPFPSELFDALVRRVEERLQERRRWAEIEGTADYLGVTVRRVRDLRERGMPAKRIGRRLLFDLREVDAWLEGQT